MSSWKRLLQLVENPKLRATLLLVLSGLSVAYYASVVHRHYPIDRWLFWTLAWLWLHTALWVAACWAGGYFVISRCLKLTEQPSLETHCCALAAGVVLFTEGMYLAGFVGAFGPVFAYAWPAALIAAGAFELWQTRRAAARALEQAHRPVGMWSRISTAVGVVCAALVYAGALTPDAISFDAAWYHLPTAQDYAREGGIVPFFTDYNRALPQLASLVYTWGFLLPGVNEPAKWMMALHLEFALFAGTLLGVGAMVNWLCRRTVTGGWAAFFLFPAIFVYDHNLGGTADHVLAFFAAPMFLATAHALTELSVKRCALLAVVAAGAVLTKYQAVYLIAGCGLLVIAAYLRLLAGSLRGESGGQKRRTAVWRVSRGPVLLLGLGVLLCLPHFLKNAWFYHNPFYPFAQHLFPSFPSHERTLEMIDHMYALKTPTGTVWARLVEAARLVFAHPFEPHYSHTGGVPVLGGLFVLLVPWTLALRHQKRFWLAILASVAGLLIWGYTYQVDRYLQALVPLFAATTGALIVELWQLGRIARLALFPLVAFQVVWGGDALVYSNWRRYRSAVTLVRSGFQRKHEQRWNYRTAYTRMRDLVPPDGVVLLHDFRMNLGIDRTLLADNPGTQGLIFYDPLDSPRALYDRYRELGITHLAFAPGNRNTTEASMQANVLFTDLFYRHAVWREKTGGLVVAELPDEPPPEQQDYQVLVIGAGYTSGLYSLRALQRYVLAPQLYRPRPPLERLEPDGSNAMALVHRAEAVVVGARAPFPPGTGLHMLGGFKATPAFHGRYTVHVRRRDTRRRSTPSSG